MVQMKNAIEDFVSKLKTDAEREGFFWFAGGGVQINTENYIMPADADYAKARQLGYK
ncbi:hypothetical protein FACS1894137_09930 [Spirochaetia bacterium]|nr:hypothetical protein FACS1894137_09930 [Spirochaetia bacterium]